MKTIIGLLLTIILSFPFPCRATTTRINWSKADLSSTNLMFFDSPTSELELLFVQPEEAKTGPELSREERKKYCNELREIMRSQPLKAQAFIDQATLDKVVELKDTCFEYAELASDYLYKSGEQILMGSYSEEKTMLGTVGGLALSFTGFDVLIDVRELSNDLLNPEWSMEWAEKTTLDVIGVLPFSDTIKLAGDVGGIILEISDNGEEIIKAARDGAALLEDSR